MAIRIGTLPDSSLIAKRLGEFRRVICASPAYLEAHGVPMTLEDLNKHRGILGTRSVPGSPRTRGEALVFDWVQAALARDPLFRHIHDVDERQIA